MRSTRSALLLAAPLLATALWAGACAAPDRREAPPAPIAEESIKPGVNERFLSPDLQVEQFTELFEGESREIAVHKDAIVAALGIEPGTHMADIGAGTGLFLSEFHRAVGRRGRLYAVDISPGFVDHMRERIVREGLGNVELVLCTERSAELPARSIDLAFVCDTYHHFEYPRSTLASLRHALRRGGRLVVVDFERIPGVSRDWCLQHVRAGKAEFTAEIEAAGFVLEREVEVEGLLENYLLVFERV